MMKKGLAILLIVTMLMTFSAGTAMAGTQGRSAGAPNGTKEAMLKEVQKYPVGSDLEQVKSLMTNKGVSTWRPNYPGDWCAWYVCACAKNVGLMGKIIKDDSDNITVRYLLANAVNAGGKAQFLEEKYKNNASAAVRFNGKGSYKIVGNRDKFEPHVGDLVFYDWSSNVSPYLLDHVGIVVGVNPVRTVEGNTGDGVIKHYNFADNTDRENCVVAYVTPNYPPSQTFTAKYNPNCNNAWGSMESTTVSYGVQTPLRTNQYVRNGYEFTGWTAKRNDGTWRYVNPSNEKQSGWYKEGKSPSGWKKYIYQDKQTVARTHTKNKGVVTFYAQWEKTKAHWFYYSLDGKTIGSPEAMYVVKGRPFSLTERIPKKSGYTFTGWTVRRVKDNKYFVSGKGWNSGQEIKNKGYNKKIYTYGQIYEFTGSWTKGCFGKSHYIFEAQWEKIPVTTFTIKYVQNGGIGSMADTTVTYGKSTTLRSNQFKREGHTFVGWTAKRDDNTWRYISPDGTSEEWCLEGNEPNGWKKYVYKNQANVLKTYAKNKGIVYFYAQWKQNEEQTFIVKYHANGGNGNMANTTVTYGKATPLRYNQFVRDGYKFVGWTAKRDNNTWRYIRPDGGKDGWYAEGKQPSDWKKYVYKDQENVLYSYNKDKGVVILYAQWEKTSVHTFYYDTNGGSNPPSPMDVANGERFSVTGSVPTKDGYTFEGWTIHRLADDKFYVVERGWFTNEEIDYEGYTKRIYTPGERYSLDKAWTTGYAGTSNYIFEAQWKEDEIYEPIETPEPPATESEVIGFVSEEEYEQRYAGNSDYEATPYYRYATRQKEYTESTSSNLVGWILYNQVNVPGASAWSKTKPASGDYETGYQYYCWGWEHNGDWTFYYDNNYNDAVAWINKNYSVWNYNQFRYFWQVYSSKKGNSVKVSQTVSYRDNNGKTGTKAISDTKLWYEGVVYRQKASTKYQFWRWSDWSGWSNWSTEKQGTSDTVKEERQYYIVKK